MLVPATAAWLQITGEMPGITGVSVVFPVPSPQVLFNETIDMGSGPIS